MEKDCREAHAPKSVVGKAAGGGGRSLSRLNYPGCHLPITSLLQVVVLLRLAIRNRNRLRLTPLCRALEMVGKDDDNEFLSFAGQFKDTRKSAVATSARFAP